MRQAATVLTNEWNRQEKIKDFLFWGELLDFLLNNNSLQLRINKKEIEFALHIPIQFENIMNIIWIWCLWKWISMYSTSLPIEKSHVTDAWESSLLFIHLSILFTINDS